ncbi:MAG: nucleoside triphosphate pyrophosphohydrolase [Myxococcaceae bacterium]|nr:nucleoside triphosphate pyrophosphohydrolase [Myxococcaceae bacterium]MCI0672159.1 nucleoside triphosphate pyrophosphohydrolase [Myxococcaceae bacterium]
MSLGSEMERLAGIMARLRAPGGCPWDREQDLRSLRPYLVEEAYEVLDEMDRVGAGGPWGPLCEELGDLLFQIVFHAQLAHEQDAFTLEDVARAIADKIERRHPHVFGEAAVSGPGQVLANWARLKADERKQKTGSEGSVLDGVPTGAPALLRAERLTEKASRIGFDWPDLAGVREKLSEELGELDAAIASGDRDAKEHELGDVLFSLANLARFIQTPAEDALRQANRRFTSRFHRIEADLREARVPFGEATLEQMEASWQKAKVEEARMPPPHGPGQVTLAALEVPVADLPRQRAFWDRVAPLLGWSALAPVPGEARYSDGALTLRFHAGQAAAAAPTLRFAVPALAPLHEALVRAGVTVDTEEPGALVFVDPAGVRCKVGPSAA